ncbi:MAG: hypothetical protein IJ727_10365 [Treponema sp.]|nr:hypothetical protein [Treponema sp.]
MRNLLLVAFSAFLLTLVSCSETMTMHDFEIENKSSKTVDFQLIKYSDKSTHTLFPNEKIILKLYDHPKFTILNNSRVSYISDFSYAYFYDMPSYNYTVTNSCLYDVTLSESNNMLGKNAGDVYTLKADDSTEIIVYSKSPNYVAYYEKDGEKYNAINYLNFLEN